MAQKRLVEIVLQGKDETKGAFGSLSESLGLANTNALKLAAGAAAVGAALVAATKKAYDFTAEMAKLGDAMAKMSDRTGLAVEQLSEFQFLVERGGGSVGDIEPAVRRLARAMGDARDGIKEAKDAFSQLGIETSQLVDGNGNLRGINEMLPMIADGMKDLQSQADRMDVAQALLGRGGTKLLPALQQGRDGIKAMREEMEKYGGAMSTTFAAKSAEFVDSQTNLATATSRLKEALSEPFLGPFTSAVNALAEAIADAKKTIWGDGTSSGVPRQPGTAAADNTGVVIGGSGELVPINPETGLPYQPWEMPAYPDSGAVVGGRRNPIVSNPRLGGVPPTAGAPRGPRNWSAPDDPSERIMDPDYDIGGFDWGSQEEAMAGLTEGFDELVESASKFGEAGAVAAATFQSALSSAFATAIMDADNAAEAIGNIFKATFANLAGSFISAGIFAALGLPVSGPFASVFGSKSVSAGTKAMPGPIQLAGAGGYMSHAMAAHGRAYI